MNRDKAWSSCNARRCWLLGSGISSSFFRPKL